MFLEFIGKMLGTDKALASVVDGASSALDKLVYTDEEKADAAASDRSEARKMVVEWMASTQGQNLARRVISLAITFTWLAIWWLGFVLHFVAVFAAAYSAKLVEAGNFAKDAASEMAGPVMLILGFYFAAPHLGDLAKAAVEKMGSSSANRRG